MGDNTSQHPKTFLRSKQDRCVRLAWRRVLKGKEGSSGRDDQRGGRPECRRCWFGKPACAAQTGRSARPVGRLYETTGWDW